MSPAVRLKRRGPLSRPPLQPRLLLLPVNQLYPCLQLAKLKPLLRYDYSYFRAKLNDNEGLFIRQQTKLKDSLTRYFVKLLHNII